MLRTLLVTLLVSVEALPVWRSSLGRVLAAWLGLGRRYGVRCHGGTQERTGFLYAAEAEAWGTEFYGAHVVFQYEPIDLRIQPSEYSGRMHFTG